VVGEQREERYQYKFFFRAGKEAIGAGVMGALCGEQEHTLSATFKACLRLVTIACPIHADGISLSISTHARHRGVKESSPFP
jgi:hypothetical protein